MKRVTIRLVVATTVMVAFVITALSGLVVYRPVQLLPALGMSLLTWHSIHDWGALVLTAAVIVHLVLHRRRVGQMISGLVRPERSPQSACRRRTLDRRTPRRQSRRRPPTRSRAACA